MSSRKRSARARSALTSFSLPSRSYSRAPRSVISDASARAPLMSLRRDASGASSASSSAAGSASTRCAAYSVCATLSSSRTAFPLAA